MKRLMIAVLLMFTATAMYAQEEPVDPLGCEFYCHWLCGPHDCHEEQVNCVGVSVEDPDGGFHTEWQCETIMVCSDEPCYEICWDICVIGGIIVERQDAPSPLLPPGQFERQVAIGVAACAAATVDITESLVGPSCCPQDQFDLSCEDCCWEWWQDGYDLCVSIFGNELYPGEPGSGANLCFMDNDRDVLNCTSGCPNCGIGPL